METKEYLNQTEKLFCTVENRLEEFEEEVDYDRSPDKLETTVEESGRKIVINTQRAIHEIWLAGNSRGWHFQYDENNARWYAQAEQVEFYKCLSELLSDQLGRQVRFP